MSIEVDVLGTACSLALILLAGAGCGSDWVRHMADDGGHREAGAGGDGGFTDAGTNQGTGGDAGVLDAGSDDLTDAGAVAGEDAGVPDDAGSSTTGGADAGSSDCTQTGVSSQLAALPGGPFQNCEGGTYPSTQYQTGTEPWSGCCNVLVRVCAVEGYSTRNVLYCQ